MQVAPSLLAANFVHLGQDIEMINSSEADWLHYDVMDGSFVPNISFGFPVMASLQKIVQKPLDVHMMTVQPEKWICKLRDHGARMMTVHQEVCPHLHRTIQEIHEAGMLAGVALNPSTPLVMVEDVLADADMVLVMSVNPGFGGQKFIEASVDKVRRLKAMINEQHVQTLIEVDGGVNMQTGAQLAAAGADVLVAGSFVFKSANPEQTIADLRRL